MRADNSNIYTDGLTEQQVIDLHNAIVNAQVFMTSERARNHAGFVAQLTRQLKDARLIIEETEAFGEMWLSQVV